MIIFISCTKRKLNNKCEAKDMYSASTWFRYAYKYAKSLNPAHIYILSAKYGLLGEHDIITPYEKTLHGAKEKDIKQWSLKVAGQIKQRNINTNEKAVFLCGKNYRKYIKNLFTEYEEPTAHLGIGKQVKYFKENI